MKRYLIILSFIAPMLLFERSVQAEGVSGVIYEKSDKGEKSPLVGVNVFWIGTTKGTFTDANGKFEIGRSGIKDYRLILSLLGYRRDTITVSRESHDLQIEMVANQEQLGEVEIKGRQDNTYVSKLNARATTVITKGELSRAACCNLAESFETNASIDVSYSDAVTGARQIQLLGLSGNYSQIMTENIPMIRGMAVTYGLNYIPGPWMESIQISKGASSVTNGFEAITGQINVEYKKPAASEKFYLNAFMNSNLRVEGNANGSIKINDKLSTMVFLHADDLSHKFDRNDDGFMDLPKLTTYNLFNRWDYINPGKYVSRFGIKYLDETRNGGQMDFNKDNYNFDTTGITERTKIYGINIRTQRGEVFWKNGLIFSNGSSLGLILYGVNHLQRSYYGINQYSGHEQTAYANLIYSAKLPDSHKLSAGLSYIYDAYNEHYYQNNLLYLYQVTGDTANGALYKLIDDIPIDHVLDRKYSIPGAYAEYTYDYKDKITVIAGARVDYINTWGWMFAPRLNIKLKIAKNTNLRVSAGKGYRLANILAENTQVFASQRVLHIENGLKPEVGWNYGLTFTQDFKLFNNNGEFTLDAYRTDFMSQVVVDNDSLPTAVFFYNLDGKSFANSLQAQVVVEPVKRLTVTLAFRVNDVKTTTSGKLQEKAMVNLYKGLLSASYATKFDKWKFDATLQVNGPQRLPDTQKMPVFLQRPGYSPVYINLLAQITRKFKYIEIYLGGENLTNYRQTDPISEYWAPYHTHFDASMVWGPIVGISVYGGIRVAIK